MPKPAYEDVQSWYRQHGPVLLAYVTSLVGDRSTAEDVLHQVFLKLLGNQIVPDDPRPYLFRAVRNAALNSRRSAARHVPLEDHAWLEMPAELVDEGLALQSAMRELPEEQREVIVMRIWGEMTLEEIAAVLELSQNTVASRYRYGLAKLRETMRPFEVGDEHRSG
jgi:RNA polymerase sigma-70 factor (ECF subfamily)